MGFSLCDCYLFLSLNNPKYFTENKKNCNKQVTTPVTTVHIFFQFISRIFAVNIATEHTTRLARACHCAKCQQSTAQFHASCVT